MPDVKKNHMTIDEIELLKSELHLVQRSPIARDIMIKSDAKLTLKKIIRKLNYRKSKR